MESHPTSQAETEENRSYYRSLMRNMVITVILVSFAPLILVGGIIMDRFQTAYREKIHAHLEELVQKHQHDIDGFLKERLGNLRFLSTSCGAADLADSRFLRQQLEALQIQYGPVFVDLGVVNEQGSQIAYAGPFQLINAQYADASWFQKALNSRYQISDVFLGLRGLPHFIITVKSVLAGQPWILRATIDFEAFNNLVENIQIGKTGRAFILNRRGEFQTSLSPFSTSETMPDIQFLTHLPHPARGVAIARHTDASQGKCIYAAASLKNGDWMLIYQQRVSDAFSATNQAQDLAVLIFLIGGLGIITVAWVLSRKMVSRIRTADLEKELMNQQVIETGKLASVGELAAGIAHEINNPVAIMVEEAGWIQDLLEEEEFEKSDNFDEFQRALKQINTQGKRCKDITHKLLSFARKTDSRIQDINPNDLVTDVVGLSSQRAKYANVEIRTQLAPDLPVVRASSSEMQQVLLNLINNALQAMEKSGGHLDIGTRLDETQVVIDVADNGPGIPRANLGRIFDPFFTTKPVGRGTGLGLSICYGIVHKMGGRIDVESVVGMGTAFHIRLPTLEDTGPAPSGHPPTAADTDGPVENA
ncbi:MAG: two-component sensor histidine kinase [Desulfobacterales bacterium]|nr:two-component sensor histidine kinase [Desulfobacterales bacterium]